MTVQSTHATTKKGTKDNPFISKVLKRHCLNTLDAEKPTYHVEIEGHPELEYQPGDSIAILPSNPCERVDPFFEFFDPETRVTYRGKELSLKEALYHHVNIDKVTKKLLKLFLDHEPQEHVHLEALLETKELLLPYIDANHVESAYRQFKPRTIEIGEMIELMAPLLPRMYSIASSQKTNPNAIHLTIATFSFTKQGSILTGVGSHFLCVESEPGDTKVPFYIHQAPHFKLPDPNTPIIMIGPGTGIAPYRAFLQERKATGASGPNWLFFGNRYRHSDYYYEEELEEYVNSGFLKLSLAFSRDQSDKIYVQDRMREEAETIWKWIEEGAIIYICGDAKRMAKDVQMTLEEMACTLGHMTEDESKAWMRALRADQRLCLDVY